MRHTGYVIIGVGVDIVAVDRVSQALRRTPALEARLFTAAERALPPRSLAARFAAKEAVAKALGAPPGLRWTDVEIPGAGAAPAVVTRGTVAEAERRLGVTRWHLSLSHDGEMAVAVAVAES